MKEGRKRGGKKFANYLLGNIFKQTDKTKRLSDSVPNKR